MEPRERESREANLQVHLTVIACDLRRTANILAVT